MEEQLLHDMINDRDEQISDVEDKLKRQDNKISKTKQTLDEFRSSSQNKKELYKKEILTIIQKYKKAHENLKHQENITKHPSGSGSSMHVYAECLREVDCKKALAAGSSGGSGKGVDSSYILRMQSQLCKAMHMMGCIDHQMVICKHHNSILIKSLKDSITEIVDSKSVREVQIMNNLMVIDTDKKQLEEIYNKILDKIRKKCNELQEQIDEDASSDSEDEDEEESDDSDNNNDETSVENEDEEDNNHSSEEEEDDDEVDHVKEDVSKIKIEDDNGNDEEKSEDEKEEEEENEENENGGYIDEIENRYKAAKNSILSQEEIETRERVKALLNGT